MLLTSSDGRDPLPAVRKAIEQLEKEPLDPARFDRTKTLDLCHVDVTSDLAEAILSLERQRRRRSKKRRKGLGKSWQTIRFDNCFGTHASELLSRFVSDGSCERLFVRCASDESERARVFRHDAFRSGTAPLDELLLMPGRIPAEDAEKLARGLKEGPPPRRVGLFELRVVGGESSSSLSLARAIAGCASELSVVLGDGPNHQLSRAVVDELRNNRRLEKLQVRTLTPHVPEDVPRYARASEWTSLFEALPNLTALRELDVSWVQVEEETIANKVVGSDELSWRSAWLDALRTSPSLRSVHVDSVSLQGTDVLRRCRLHAARAEELHPSDHAVWPTIMGRINRMRFRSTRKQDDDDEGRAEVIYHLLRERPGVIMER